MSLIEAAGTQFFDPEGNLGYRGPMQTFTNVSTDPVTGAVTRTPVSGYYESRPGAQFDRPSPNAIGMYDEFMRVDPATGKAAPSGEYRWRDIEPMKGGIGEWGVLLPLLAPLAAAALGAGAAGGALGQAAGGAAAGAGIGGGASGLAGLGAFETGLGAAGAYGGVGAGVAAPAFTLGGEALGSGLTSLSGVTGGLPALTDAGAALAAPQAGGMLPMLSATSAPAAAPGALSSIANVLGTSMGNVPLGNAIGSGLAATGAMTSAGMQADAAKRAADIATALREPYTSAGTEALARLRAGLLPGGEFAKPFTMEDAKNSEAMKVALAQGREAIQGSAAAKGGLLGTNTLAGLTDYGQKVGAQYQNQAFNQWLQERSAMLDPLKAMVGLGAQQTGAVADTAANAALAAGGAKAAGTVGALNQIGAGISDVTKTALQMETLGRLFGTGGQ